MEKDCEACLGELFSAQKIKVEEAQEELRELDKIHKEEVILFQESIDQMVGCLKDIKNSFPSWTKTYKKISKFLADRGI